MVPGLGFDASSDYLVRGNFLPLRVLASGHN